MEFFCLSACKNLSQQLFVLIQPPSSRMVQLQSLRDYRFSMDCPSRGIIEGTEM